MSILDLFKIKKAPPALVLVPDDDGPGWYVLAEQLQSGNLAVILPYQITQSMTRPAADNQHFWFGPYHCQKCAEICAFLGKTDQQAFDFNHGTDDEKFGVFFNGE